METGRGYREDDQIKRGEAQVYQLQQQVDELRRMLRETMARQNTSEDYFKQNQAMIFQMRDQIDKQVSESGQAIQVRVLEEHRIKQELAELQVRANEPLKPLRDLRSQMAEILDQRRREGEQTGLDKMALDKLSTQIRDSQAQIGRLDNHIKDLREAVKITANSQEYYQRELERVTELIHGWEQVVRRQTEEFREEIKTLRSEVQLFTNRISRLEDLQRQDSARIEEFPPILDALRQEDDRLLIGITRSEKLYNERIAIVQDRLEEIRQQSDSAILNLNQLFSSQVDSDSIRYGQLDDRIRTTDGQLQETQLRIEQLKQVNDSELYDIYQLVESLSASQVERTQSEFDMVRQSRAKSQAAGLGGRRAVRNTRRNRAESGYETAPEDNSI